MIIFVDYKYHNGAIPIWLKINALFEDVDGLPVKRLITLKIEKNSIYFFFIIEHNMLLVTLFIPLNLL